MVLLLLGYSASLRRRRLQSEMETSLRLRGGGGGGGSNGGGLRIHAKERLPVGSNALLQAHAEVDTTTGAPSYLAVLVRHFSPQFSANIGVGIHLHSPAAAGHDFTYSLRAKKAIPFTSKGFLGIILKARLLADKQFNPTKRTGAVEFACDIFDLRKDQDVRLKFGYELYHKMPYFQLRESNWTVNAYMDGKWDIRFDM